jgi:ergothioneine biosynthesis protein EgtB
MSVVGNLPAVGPELRARIRQARQRSDQLFEAVQADHLYDRPIPERHRIIFYIGHLEAFDWNLFRERIFREPTLDPGLDRLFAFGIDPVGGGLPTDQPSDWPALPEVKGYVGRVRSAIDRALEDGPVLAAGQEGDYSASQLMEVAIEHRLMHCETLAYMLHQLPFSSKIPQPQEAEPLTRQLTPSMIDIPAGKATLGLSRGDGVFGWDNEFAKHTAGVPAFAIDHYKVTNGEYLEFMKAGGYENRALWEGEDWQWRSENAITHPVFWSEISGKWFYRGMFEELPLPSDWPVYVSHAEASAYARWVGKQLPSEAQWQRAAYGRKNGEEAEYPWGGETPSLKTGNFDFARWDPAAVQGYEAGESGFGVSGMVGNGWEWTSTVFGPFPGFERFSFYPGYSADFFDGKHYVMKGASARTAACLLRRSFRNWFQTLYQYVYAGFRCVTS